MTLVSCRIVRVRETRITGVMSHILIGLSLLMLPRPLSFIPRAVLDGLFLYLAINALNHNQLFDRILLLVTEQVRIALHCFLLISNAFSQREQLTNVVFGVQAAYPPNHYIRSVPQRKVHMFTAAQIIQLAVMCGFGFSPYPYLKMTFPILILLLLPLRYVSVILPVKFGLFCLFLCSVRHSDCNLTQTWRIFPDTKWCPE